MSNQNSEKVTILTEQEFLKAHGTHFYSKYPTREAFQQSLQDKINKKLSKPSKKLDASFFIEHTPLFIETLSRDIYDNYGYLHFLKEFYRKKLKVDTNELSKAIKKMAKGVKIIPANKSESGNKEFRPYGTDQGRAIINNLSYQEIATCKKGKPVDILTWEAYNDVSDLKHLMRPAYWKNVVNDLNEANIPTPQLQKKNFDILIKLVSMFADKASVFRTGTYAGILNHYAPEAETSLHLVGSWNTPTLAAPSLTRLKHQVIIDVIPRQQKVGEFIYNNFIPTSLTNPKHKYDFIICPSEQLQNRLDFENKYKDYFDVQLFSPVYFDTEIYSTVSDDAGEQSIDSFPTYEKWIEGYFHQTIKTAYEVMKPGSKFIIVISDFEYTDKNSKKTYFISHDMLTITSNYFKPLETADLILTQGSGFMDKAQKEKRSESRKNLFSEHIHVFTKEPEYYINKQQDRDNFKIADMAYTPEQIQETPSEDDDTDIDFSSQSEDE